MKKLRAMVKHSGTDSNQLKPVCTFGTFSTLAGRRICCTYLTKECLHGGPVLHTWQPVQPSHEGLAEVPGAWSVASAHHVNSVSVRRRCLSDEVAVHGAPSGVSQVVVPPIVPLLLVGRLLHSLYRGCDAGQHQQDEGATPLTAPRQHRVASALHI